MRNLGTSLEILGFLLLLVEAIGERRAARWNKELEDTYKDAESVYRGIFGERMGRAWWRLDFRTRFVFLIGIWTASMVARFDGWKERHGLTDFFFVLAIICAAGGIVLSLVF